MAEHPVNPLVAALFPAGTSFSEEQIKQLVELYKLFVSTSEALVVRRQVANTFFLTINSLLLGVIGGFASRTAVGAWLSLFAISALSVVGMALCFSWRRLVRSYRELNTGKFKVIELLEQHLPASIFKAEWQALGSGGDRSLYTPFTRTEATVPLVFGLLYAGVVIGVMAMTAGTSGVATVVRWILQLVGA